MSLTSAKGHYNHSCKEEGLHVCLYGWWTEIFLTRHPSNYDVGIAACARFSPSTVFQLTGLQLKYLQAERAGFGLGCLGCS